jgi:hypothetical protein
MSFAAPGLSQLPGVRGSPRGLYYGCVVADGPTGTGQLHGGGPGRVVIPFVETHEQATDPEHALMTVPIMAIMQPARIRCMDCESSSQSRGCPHCGAFRCISSTRRGQRLRRLRNDLH